MVHIESEGEERQRLERQEKDILADPSRDYFDECILRKPKQEVGEYVADQGFNVPLITDPEEWREAFDNGTAMIRSELPQDYRGFSGLLESTIVYPNNLLAPELYGDLKGNFTDEMHDLVKEGVRNGGMSPEGFMRMCGHWGLSESFVRDQASRLGVEAPLDYHHAASTWRYVEGTNIRMFRDPSVEDRYHLAATPSRGYILAWQIDAGNHDKALDQERSDHELVPSRIIDFYESIRNLPRFDQSQAPLMEIQMDKDGELNFLQYLKTGHSISPVDEFELPANKEAIRTDNVRGVTEPDGQELRLYIAPKKITKRMKGQGFYFDNLRPYGFAQQYLSIIGKAVVHCAYVSLKDNHFNSAPLYRPQVGMGLNMGEVTRTNFKKLIELVHGKNNRDIRPDHSVYIDTKITSNGREATLETDWEPKLEETP
jgi:hypothetical protein